MPGVIAQCLVCLHNAWCDCTMPGENACRGQPLDSDKWWKATGASRPEATGETFEGTAPSFVVARTICFCFEHRIKRKSRPLKTVFCPPKLWNLATRLGASSILCTANSCVFVFCLLYAQPDGGHSFRKFEFGICSSVLSTIDKQTTFITRSSKDVYFFAGNWAVRPSRKYYLAVRVKTFLDPYSRVTLRNLAWCKWNAHDSLTQNKYCSFFVWTPLQIFANNHHLPEQL